MEAKLESISLHIENLIPGLVVAPLLFLLIPTEWFKHFTSDQLEQIFEEPSGRLITYFAAAYLVGIVAFVVSRLVIDTILAQLLFRPFFFFLLCRDLFEGEAKNLKKGWFLRNKQYMDTLSKALNEDSKPITAELQRRRERGRLLRATLIPLVLAIWHLQHSWFFCLIATLILALLYVYVEYMVFQEAAMTAKQNAVAN